MVAKGKIQKAFFGSRDVHRYISPCYCLLIFLSAHLAGEQIGATRQSARAEKARLGQRLDLGQPCRQRGVEKRLVPVQKKKKKKKEKK